MSIWYGKNCKYQNCQWEDTEIAGEPDHKENLPCLIFCNHKNNKNPNEGNCSTKYCPLTIKGLSAMSVSATKQKVESGDVQDIIIELEHFRIHLPLHTRQESGVVCDKVISKLIEMDLELTKLRALKKKGI